MKHLILILLVIGIHFSVSSQIFKEVCDQNITNGTVVDFELYKGTIYATGFFDTICGQNADYIAKWEDSTWIPANFGLTDPGHSLKTIDSLLYIARYEESVDSNWVYTYDGDSLQKLGTGIYLTTASAFSELPNIYDIVKYDNSIIACGTFDRVGSQSISGIMRWDGSQWNDMQGGVEVNFNCNFEMTSPMDCFRFMTKMDMQCYTSDRLIKIRLE